MGKQGHNRKIKKKTVVIWENTSVKVNFWNGLPPDVIVSNSNATFWIRLGRYINELGITYYGCNKQIKYTCLTIESDWV